MKAIMYGGGNIGRGFVGALLSQSGYEVTFIDVADAVVNGLYERGGYPVRIVDTDGSEDMRIEHVSAIHGGDTERVAEAIAECDIMATAVGVNVLKFVVPNLAEGIRRRMARGSRPLNILICENLMDANKVLEGMLREQLSPGECARFDAEVGLVEASIGRMVPVQTEAMKDGDPLRVCVERYGFLPVDGDAFRGPIPEVRSMIPASPFGFYLKRKLYIHNMGHACCAYLGMLSGMEFIWQAVSDPDIQLIARGAMQESMEALCLGYGAEPLPVLRHIDDLLMRFSNRALGDTCARVGGDPVRKLGPSDRLIGAALLCEAHGVVPAHIAIGIAGALRHYVRDVAPGRDAACALQALSGIAPDSPTGKLALSMYGLLESGDLGALRAAAWSAKKPQYQGVV